MEGLCHSILVSFRSLSKAPLQLLKSCKISLEPSLLQAVHSQLSDHTVLAIPGILIRKHWQSCLNPTPRQLQEARMAGQGCWEMRRNITELPSSPCSQQPWNGHFPYKSLLLVLGRRISKPQMALKVLNGERRKRRTEKRRRGEKRGGKKGGGREEEG